MNVLNTALSSLLFEYFLSLSFLLKAKHIYNYRPLAWCRGALLSKTDDNQVLTACFPEAGHPGIFPPEWVHHTTDLFIRDDHQFKRRKSYEKGSVLWDKDGQCFTFGTNLQSMDSSFKCWEKHCWRRRSSEPAMSSVFPLQAGAGPTLESPFCTTTIQNLIFCIPFTPKC